MIAELKNTIANTPDLYTQKPFGETAILMINGSDSAISIVMEVPYPCALRQEALSNHLISAVTQKHPTLKATSIDISWQSKIAARKAQKGLPLLPSVKNIVAIASGKGGVGKSTTAVNIALAMAAEGARVGILDADIYGPSIPQMLGIADKRPQSGEKGGIVPLNGHGLQAISIGFMVDTETPMVWRGPMVSQALEQLVKDTLWDELDYLFVDMPPGTGDIQLTLSQKVPLTGAVIVTTPQDIALLDARRGLKMFEQVGVSILGLVENMSVYCCPQCGHKAPIFGEGGAKKMSADYEVEMLGHLPLSLSIREKADSGMPTVVSDPTSDTAQTYRDIAHKIAVTIAKKQKNFDSKMPNIVIQNT